MSEFTIGLWTYRLTQFEQVEHWARQPLVVGAVTAVLLASLCTPGLDVLAVMTMSPLLLVLASGGNPVSRLMGSRVVFFLGEISYSIYLLHAQFLRVRRIGEVGWLASSVGTAAADIAALTVFYAALILCSWVTYQLVERPCRAWFREREYSRKAPLLPLESAG